MDARFSHLVHPYTREEIFQKRSTFRLEDPLHDLDAMIQPLVLYNVEQRTARACLRVWCAEDQCRNACEDDRSGAHRARFERYIQRASFQPVIVELACGCSDRDDLGVSGGVSQRFCLIIPAPDDAVVMNDHGSHRNFLPLVGLLGFLERKLHPAFVLGHGERSLCVLWGRC